MSYGSTYRANQPTEHVYIVGPPPWWGQVCGGTGTFPQETTKLAEQRNRVIHDPWLRKERRTLHRFETTARRKLRHEEVAVSLNELNNLVRNIEKHHDKFKELTARIEDHDLP